jgi:DNA-binding SARP family transcriptional activator/tetratricopeptide (TPR) repeat protein
VIEFRALGPVELWACGRRWDLGPAKQRAVLAALLLDAGRPVAVEALIDRVWDQSPPVQARGTVYAHIARIRRTLARAAPDLATPCVERGPAGYVLVVEPDQVDVSRFQRLVEPVRESGRHGQSPGEEADQARARSLRDALGLWRGTPLAGIGGDWAGQVRHGLEQQRLAAVLEWARVEARLGHAASTIEPLRQLAAEHPLVEPLVAELMRALFGAGRGAEALERFAVARAELARELGADPGPELAALHQAILRGETTNPVMAQAPGAAAHRCGATTVAPAQLPADLATFTGREEYLRMLDELLPGSGDVPGGRPRNTVVISTIAGAAGVGKSTLAVHWAHRVRDRFPDGQLYVNLRGFDPSGSATEPGEAIRGFLDALEVPTQRIPVRVDAQAGLYRSLLAGKRMLIVLDNARDAEQVRPLLPGSPGCLALVTSRDRLTSLVATEGAHPVALDLLTPKEARELLARRVGGPRIASEPDAVEEIIAWCAGLPLALAIVAARATTAPQFPLWVLAQELRAARTGLAGVSGGDPATDLCAVFSWSLRAVSDDAARLFRLLGLHRGPDIGVAAAASLAGVPVNGVLPLLAQLTSAHLLAETAPGRFRLRDLLRRYAIELTRSRDSESDRTAAVHHLFDHYLHSAFAADRLLDWHRDPIHLDPALPGVTVEGPATEGEAIGWFRTELPVLLATVQHASGDGFDAHAWRLAWTLANFFDRQGHWRDWVTTQRIVLEAARRMKDRNGQALAHRALGRAHTHLGEFEDAETHFHRSLDLFALLGDATGKAYTHLTLAFVLGRRDRNVEALRHAGEALALYEASGHLVGRARALNAVGWHHTRLGNYSHAIRRCERALALFEDLDDGPGHAATWNSLAEAHHHLGVYTEAIVCYRRALELYRDLGDRGNEGAALTGLGETYRVFGDPDAAWRTWQQALDIFEELGHSDADRLRAKLNVQVAGEERMVESRTAI